MTLTFFRNSLCFMCLWFGLEILRLVFKKAFFKILNVFLSYLTFNPPKKVALPLIRVEKKFFKIVRKGYQKKRNFVLISKMCRSVEVNKRGKFFSEKLIFQALRKFGKRVFLSKNLWELLDARDIHIF